MFVLSKALFRHLKRAATSMHFLFHVLWISLCNCIVGKPNIDHSKAANAVVAVVGDDFVVGIGDWCVVGRSAGFVTHLENAINKLPTVRRWWQCEKLGVSRSTTQDWAPSSPVPYGNSKNLFEHAFHPSQGILRSAPVVCLMVGTNDTGEPESTVAAVREIAQALHGMGKRVIVSTAQVRNGVPAIMERTRKRNSLLRELQKCTTGPYAGLVVAGPDLECPMGGAWRYFRFGHYFSGAGYKKLAEDWKDCIHPELTKVEWKWFTANALSQSVG